MLVPSVEERVDRLVGEGDRGEAMAPGPLIDLANAFRVHRTAQIFAQPHRPQADHRMRLTARGGAGEIGAGLVEPLREAGDEIPRQKRRVGRNADDQRAIRPVLRRPIEPGQHARQRPGEPGDAVGCDRQIEPAEPRRVSIGVQHQSRDLRP